MREREKEDKLRGMGEGGIEGGGRDRAERRSQEMSELSDRVKR